MIKIENNMSPEPANPIRVGALAAARITAEALLVPAKEISGVKVVAIASHSWRRAHSVAQRHRIAKVYSAYDDLLADAEIDAVYIASPNALHAESIVAALRAGKHVLCEKPLVSNSTEAHAVEVESAKNPQLVVMEAYHWRYHPLAADLMTYLAKIGTPLNVRVRFAFPLLRLGDIRWKFELAGGATMDVGCYAVSFIQMLTEASPRVVSAKALTLHRSQIDRRMDADILLSNGCRAQLTASMLSRATLGQMALVEGVNGRIAARNPFTAHRNGRLSVTVGDGSPVVIDYPAHPTTYRYQLEAFLAAVRGAGTNLTPPADATKNLYTIDQIYTAAGLRPRPSRPGSVNTPTTRPTS
jgi:predicted dehydrogenase